MLMLSRDLHSKTYIGDMVMTITGIKRGGVDLQFQFANGKEITHHATEGKMLNVGEVGVLLFKTTAHRHSRIGFSAPKHIGITRDNAVCKHAKCGQH